MACRNVILATYSTYQAQHIYIIAQLGRLERELLNYIKYLPSLEASSSRHYRFLSANVVDDISTY